MYELFPRRAKNRGKIRGEGRNRSESVGTQVYSDANAFYGYLLKCQRSLRHDGVNKTRTCVFGTPASVSTRTFIWRIVTSDTKAYPIPYVMSRALYRIDGNNKPSSVTTLWRWVFPMRRPPSRQQRGWQDRMRPDHSS